MPSMPGHRISSAVVKHFTRLLWGAGERPNAMSADYNALLQFQLQQCRVYE